LFVFSSSSRLSCSWCHNLRRIWNESTLLKFVSFFYDIIQYLLLGFLLSLFMKSLVNWYITEVLEGLYQSRSFDRHLNSFQTNFPCWSQRLNAIFVLLYILELLLVPFFSLELKKINVLIEPLVFQRQTLNVASQLLIFSNQTLKHVSFFPKTKCLSLVLLLGFTVSVCNEFKFLAYVMIFFVLPLVK